MALASRSIDSQPSPNNEPSPAGSRFQASSLTMGLLARAPSSPASDDMVFPVLDPTPEAMVTAFSPRTWRQQLPVVRPLELRDDLPAPNKLGATGPVDDDAYITIPAHHHTTTSSLFSLPAIKSLVGYYPPNLFYDIESSQDLNTHLALDCDLASLLAEVDLAPDTTAGLIANYFSNVHPKFPILDHGVFLALFQRALPDGYSYDADLAICLLVLALGVLVSTEGNVGSHRCDDGMPYFRIAYRILTTQWAGSFSSRAQPTGLILAAIYFCFKAMPLAAWKMAYMASNNLQLLAHDPSVDINNNNADADMLSRLCWTCFVIECDSLSEFHLPRSGIEVAIDRMYFPQLGGHNNRNALLFLALCSIRRLLNRVHNAVYTSANKNSSKSFIAPDIASAEPTDQQAALAQLLSMAGVIDELQRQLDAWYDSLPELIKPDLSTTVPQDTQDAWLRIRYWSAKHIISRPSLVYAARWADGTDLPDYVYRYAEMCIESSRCYIETVIHTLNKRTHYSWMVVQACLSNSMLLATAAMSPPLQHLVPDINSILMRLPHALQPWALPDSSAEAIIVILQNLRHKIRLRPRSKNYTNS
ncbi:Transcription factor [Niveomyces insectorum RCEF 264]|uniref:Transcription factor n=1 Tax=Niveomyces insectorum RCEF 264 TaxID=1081102 RepID=A0A167MSZ4_9HYPO|nr:Transcription factor [Niveomyces insectorum RCEF 264]